MRTRFTARRLPRHRGRSGWGALLPEPPPPRVLEADTTADVTVIGAGFAGLSAARRLAQLNPGARIVVLDAGRIGEGAAGRNSGFMVDLPHELTSEDYAGDSAEADRRLIALNRGAIDFAGEAVAEYGIDANFFDRAGKTNGAGSPATVAHNESYAAHLAGLGERYELLDAPAMHELTGSRHYLSGLYTPGTVVLQPAGYVRGFAAGLARVAEVHENSPVTAFARDGTGGDAGWRVETPRGAVTSARIVLATNGHLESFGIARGRLMHIFLFACMTEELGPELRARLGGAPRWGITPSDPMGTTMRRIDAGQGGHRIVTRTCAEFRPGMTTRAGQMRRAARVMRRKFDARFPALAGVRMEHAWAGHLCLSWNGVSVTGEIEDGVFAACCQNGLGTTRGTLTGICAAENASGVSSDVTAHFGAQPAPARLAPPPLAQIGATAVLRWREWRARSE